MHWPHHTSVLVKDRKVGDGTCVEDAVLMHAYAAVTDAEGMVSYMVVPVPM